MFNPKDALWMLWFILSMISERWKKETSADFRLKQHDSATPPTSYTWPLTPRSYLSCRWEAWGWAKPGRHGNSCQKQRVQGRLSWQRGGIKHRVSVGVSAPAVPVLRNSLFLCFHTFSRDAVFRLRQAARDLEINLCSQLKAINAGEELLILSDFPVPAHMKSQQH